jgi:hypothetical protein
MARRSQDTSRQLNLHGLFQVPRPPEPVGGSLNFGLELRATLSRVLKDCPDSREVIAGRMSELLGADISVHQLNAWTAESRESWRFPFEFAAAFEQATGCHSLTELLARKRGCTVLVGEESLKVELGRLEMKESEIKKRKQMLKRYLEKGGTL